MFYLKLEFQSLVLVGKVQVFLVHLSQLAPGFVELGSRSCLVVFGLLLFFAASPSYSRFDFFVKCGLCLSGSSLLGFLGNTQLFLQLGDGGFLFPVISFDFTHFSLGFLKQTNSISELFGQTLGVLGLNSEHA